MIDPPPDDRTPPAPDLDIRRIEGIDDALRERLSGADINDLHRLADTDPDRIEVAGIGHKRLKGFVDMARLLVTYPELSGNDVEVLMKGLGIHAPGCLSTADRPSDAALKKAMGGLKLPVDYDPAAVRALLENL